jgi:hypothetical protein
MTSTEQMREATQPHLRMSLQGKMIRLESLKHSMYSSCTHFLSEELGLINGTEMLVGDPARASAMRIILTLTSSMDTSTTA